MTNKANKGGLLTDFFFSKLPNANLSDIDKYCYLILVNFKKVVNHKIENIIKDVSKKKNIK